MEEEGLGRVDEADVVAVLHLGAAPPEGALLGEVRLNGPVLKGADLIILSVFIAILL